MFTFNCLLNERKMENSQMSSYMYWWSVSKANSLVGGWNCSSFSFCYCVCFAVGCYFASCTAKSVEPWVWFTSDHPHLKKEGLNQLRSFHTTFNYAHNRYKAFKTLDTYSSSVRFSRSTLKEPEVHACSWKSVKYSYTMHICFGC